MATQFLNTGEAFLSADDKRFARVRAIRQTIGREEAMRRAPALAGAAVAVAIAGLTLIAFAV